MTAHGPQLLSTEEAAMFDAFINGRLSKDEWTHEAHLTTCWVALQGRTPQDALSMLRGSIRTHNCGVGTPNTDTTGYHESLTVYYVTAISQISHLPSANTLASPDCTRVAPLQYWTKDCLMSTEARMAWVAPDVSPLPWTPVTAD